MPTAPVAERAVDEPTKTEDGEDRPTVPAFDTDEAPTHPLASDVDDAPLAAPSPPSGSAEPALTEAVAHRDTPAGESPPSSTRQSVRSDEHADGITFDYAPDPFAPDPFAPDPFAPGTAVAPPLEQATSPGTAVAPPLEQATSPEPAVALPLEQATSPEPAAAPPPLEHATSPESAEANPPATALSAPHQLAGPRSASRRTRWVIAAAVLATIAVSAVVFMRSSAHPASGSARAMREGGPVVPSARGAPSESQRSSVEPGAAPASAPAASAASAPAASAASAPAASAASAPEESGQGSSEAESAPTAPVPQSASDMPEGLDREIVLQRVRSVLNTAAHCHEGGRATGTATVVLTFEGKGHVIDARVEGEPIASAPVAGCILTYARSIIVPRFTGEPFTVREPITLR